MATCMHNLCFIVDVFLVYYMIFRFLAALWLNINTIVNLAVLCRCYMFMYAHIIRLFRYFDCICDLCLWCVGNTVVSSFWDCVFHL